TTVATWTLSLSQAGYTSSPYTVDLSDYSGMGYVAIRHWDCYDQWVLCIDDITIVEGEIETGMSSATYYEGEACTVTATANTGYQFVNWTENGTVVSTDANYSFTVTSDRDLVANFGETVTQSVTLAAGWNWWAPSVEVTLNQLTAALGTHGLTIESQGDGSLTYENGSWSGDLQSLVAGKMYKIQVGNTCCITLSGTALDNVSVNPSDGITWFGYTGPTTQTISAALGDFTPSAGDKIVDQDEGFAIYNGTSWEGTLTGLKHGKGYIYITATANTLTF
ncbi:MAG: hypothetical protein IJ622_06450, partial [Bacteroidales bacterium]|nr:hypothetical protein [Bacteroidales bacterium]